MNWEKIPFQIRDAIDRIQKEGIRTEITGVQGGYRVEFFCRSRDDAQVLFETERELERHAIRFDTGYDIVQNRRDWELDSSLRKVRGTNVGSTEEERKMLESLLKFEGEKG